jgi:cytochrome c oxidase subunit 2
MYRRRYLTAWVAIAVGTSAAIWQARPRAQQAVHEVAVNAKKFEFEPSTIQVTAGEPVRLVIRSADGVHGFAIRGLNIDVQAPKGGEPVTVEFTAPPAGRYEVACSEFCGTGHARMKAALVSVAPTRTAR